MPSNKVREISRLKLECDEALNDAINHLDDNHFIRSIERTENALKKLLSLKEISG